MSRLSPEGERQELEAIAELAKQPKVHMKDDDCPSSREGTHIGITKCILCGAVFGAEMQMPPLFGELSPSDKERAEKIIAFVWSDEAKNMTCEQARAEIDKRWPKRDKADGPKEADKPDWAAVLKLARDTLAERKGPNYSDDSDMPQYIYEAVMEAVFPGYFAWVRTL